MLVEPGDNGFLALLKLKWRGYALGSPFKWCLGSYSVGASAAAINAKEKRILRYDVPSIAEPW